MIQPRPANPYLKTKILTASPEELRLMLYDGAIKFCRQAKDALAQQNFEQSFNGLMRAQKIVLELSTSLNHTIAPELTAKLSALYTYIYRRLVDANLNRVPAPIDEVIGLLEYERQTWQLLMKKLVESPDPSGHAARITHSTQAQQTAMSSLSLNG